MDLPETFSIREAFDLLGWQGSRKGLARHLQSEGFTSAVVGNDRGARIMWRQPATMAARRVTPSSVVDRPSHYTQGGVECIDAIEAALGATGFIAFLRGQVIKYQWRLGLKDSAAQDAAKAHWYSTRLQTALAAAGEA